MSKHDILVLFLVIFAVGFSFYRRYVKNKEKSSTESHSSGSFSSNSKDDDYEPYSKK